MSLRTEPETTVPPLVLQTPSLTLALAALRPEEKGQLVMRQALWSSTDRLTPDGDPVLPIQQRRRMVSA
jgi:hypothetical protein